MDLATVDHLLTTTRAVRRRMDFTRPVEPELIDECLEIAIQAPSGSNVQDWHFLVVTDDEPRRAIAGLYERAWKEIAAPRLRDLGADDPQAEAYARVISSATYLAEHIHDVPAFVIPCIRRRFEGASLVAQASAWGSILPPRGRSCSPPDRVASGPYGPPSTSITSGRPHPRSAFPTTSPRSH